VLVVDAELMSPLSESHKINEDKSYGTMRHVRSGKNMRDTRGYKPKPA